VKRGIMHIYHFFEYLYQSDKKIFFLKDSYGRPLGETKISEANRIDVEIELVKCPYSGSRLNHPKPMNVSPLKSIVSNWKGILLIVNQVRSHVLRNRKNKKVIRLGELLKICELISRIPLFDYIFSNQIIPTAETAGLFKTFIGPRGVLRNLVELSLINKNISINSEIHKKTLIEYIENTNSLIGANEVCAGPNHLVSELIEVLCEGRQKISNHSSFDENRSLKKILAFSEFFYVLFLTRKILCGFYIFSELKKGNSLRSLSNIMSTGFFHPDQFESKNLKLNKKLLLMLLSEEFKSAWKISGDIELSRLSLSVRKVLISNLKKSNSKSSLLKISSQIQNLNRFNFKKSLVFSDLKIPKKSQNETLDPLQIFLDVRTEIKNI
jgi:hypothetical protein